MLFPSVKALANPAIQNRAQLIMALRTAAELEHLLACEYLFTDFTIRRKLSDFPPEIPKPQRLVTLERSRLWLGQILLVARQEMEHLGIVMNLLDGVIDRTSDWNVRYWLGGYDGDVMRGYLRGRLTVPFTPNPATP